MSSTCSQYYGVIKKVSSLAGQWPYQTPKMRLFCISLVTLSTFSLVIPQTVKFIKCDRDLICVFESMTSYTLTVLTLVKLYTCYLNRYKIKIFVDHFFIDWDRLETPEEYEIMKKYAENSRRFSLGYSSYCFISVGLFMCWSLIPELLDVILPLNESRPVFVPYPGHYFVNEEEYFLYIFCHAIVSVEIMMTGIVAHDCMLLTCIEYVCSIFALAGFRFEQLTYENTAVKVLHTYCDDYRKRIAFSVRMHQRALKFAQFLTDMFSLSLAIQVTLNALVISITLLQITQWDTDYLHAMKYVLYIVAQLIHLFYLNFEGQKLIDHSTQMREKIYDSLWYKTPVKSKKILLFVIQRSCQPIFLNAGKIFIFSLESFTMILQTSMSYFTVLASLE